MQDQKGQKHNRLIKEKSPYLLQHADNPVDWRPWGKEAFLKARDEDKPVFLSIGYSTCHWCHVMERESFQDPEVARLMNQTFVSIKVDREERPDLDSVYMSVAQAMSGRAGWPLTIIMTPEKKPFYAATYIPKHTRMGMPGMLDLVPRVSKLWQDQKQRVTDIADKIVAEINRPSPECASHAPGEEDLRQAFEQLIRNFDHINGGFGAEPKFPSPHNYAFLLRCYARTKDKEALDSAEKTLQAMSRGGIFDHLGYGFHRYSTTADWLVPHFEKMLYDQALLAMLYTEAFQATGKREYEETLRKILEYVLRDLASPEGGFYSAEDAESEGEEGKFYLWTLDQVKEALEPEQVELASKVFNVQPEGNFFDPAAGRKTGDNILHMKKPLPELARNLGMDEEELENAVSGIRETLLVGREKREHPFLDDKVLADWNGLMIAALAKAGRALSEPVYVAAAARAADFVLTEMRTPGGRLLHRWRHGDADIHGFLEDYSYLCWGLVELYEADFRSERLRAALELTGVMLEHFWDEREGGFFISADYAEQTIVRHKDAFDGAMPSGNSVAALNLFRLGRIIGDPEMESRAEEVIKAFYCTIQKAPAAFTHMLSALDFAIGPASEVVIAGERGSDDTDSMLSALEQGFVPNKVVILRPEEDHEIAELVPYLENMEMLGGKATAYVCRNFQCKQPVTDPDKMMEALVNAGD